MALLYAFRADTRTINLPYAFETVDLGVAFLSRSPRHRLRCVVLVAALLLWLLLTATDLGKAIRAVAKERLGASSPASTSRTSMR